MLVKYCHKPRAPWGYFVAVATVLGTSSQLGDCYWPFGEVAFPFPMVDLVDADLTAAIVDFHWRFVNSYALGGPCCQCSHLCLKW